MPNKYQRALQDMKQGATWQKIADEISEALGETVHRSDVWNVANGKSSSVKVEQGLELLGYVEPPSKRYRLAADFPDDETRQRFKEHYGIDNDELTFTDWVFSIWEHDTIGNTCTTGDSNGDNDISTNGSDGL